MEAQKILCVVACHALLFSCKFTLDGGKCHEHNNFLPSSLILPWYFGSLKCEHTIATVCLNGWTLLTSSSYVLNGCGCFVRSARFFTIFFWLFMKFSSNWKIFSIHCQRAEIFQYSTNYKGWELTFWLKKIQKNQRAPLFDKQIHIKSNSQKIHG